jgi:hypothetical protein
MIDFWLVRTIESGFPDRHVRINSIDLSWLGEMP